MDSVYTNNFFAYSGAIASIWITIGIYIAALFYPNYSHSKQFCSELGALGSPTQKLSPLINNYPLGMLFNIFGFYLIAFPDMPFLYEASPDNIPQATLIGVMIIIHGIGTWIAGYFPMDRDPYTQTPTTSFNTISIKYLIAQR